MNLNLTSELIPKLTQNGSYIQCKKCKNKAKMFLGKHKRKAL